MKYLKRHAVRGGKIGRILGYAVLVSNRFGIEDWRIQRGHQEPGSTRFRSRKAVTAAIRGES